MPSRYCALIHALFQAEGEGHDDMQRDFIIWALYGLAAAGLIGLIVATMSALCGVIDKIERCAREIVMVMSHVNNWYKKIKKGIKAKNLLSFLLF